MVLSIDTFVSACTGGLDAIARKLRVAPLRPGRCKILLMRHEMIIAAESRRENLRVYTRRNHMCISLYVTYIDENTACMCYG